MSSHAGNATSCWCAFLLEFNLQADDKRREAEDAMRRLPIISSMVASAREKTDRAETILGNAASESKAASSIAGEAKEITMGIQQVRTSPGAIAGKKEVWTDKPWRRRWLVTPVVFVVDVMHWLFC